MLTIYEEAYNRGLGGPAKDSMNKETQWAGA
jgi:hypothetical protein